MDIKEIKKFQQQQAQNFFSKQIEQVIIFEEENNLILPFKEKEDFAKFDNALCNESKLRENFVSIFEKTYFKI